MGKGKTVKTGQVVRALGLMSGTSMDGIDAAVVETDGAERLVFGPTAYRPYSSAEREILRAAQGRWPGAPGVAEAQAVVLAAHAEIAAGFEGIDLVGFHGQTLAHDPRGRGTHQVGDGSELARALGVPVVWDFRSADVRLGGEGAPLAPFFHWALARHLGEAGPVAFLNLGGVGNVSWVDPSCPAPEAPGACLAFDTGPANGPLDELLLARRGVPCDRDGALAAEGVPDAEVLEAFAEHPYFFRVPPKSLDRNDFAALLDQVAGLSDADAAATLTAAAALAVARAEEHFPRPPSRVIVGGGGRRNPTLMAMIAAGLAVPIVAAEDAGLDGDMLEAQAFAWLAVRVLRGLPTSGPGTTGVAAPVGGGTLSRP